jgi:hypothetical protein
MEDTFLFFSGCLSKSTDRTNHWVDLSASITSIDNLGLDPSTATDYQFSCYDWPTKHVCRAFLHAKISKGRRRESIHPDDFNMVLYYGKTINPTDDNTKFCGEFIIRTFPVRLIINIMYGCVRKWMTLG